MDLISATGDVIGKRDDFKMNTSIIHESGALILDSSDFLMMDKNLRPITTTTTAKSATQDLARREALAAAPGSPTAAEPPRENYDNHYDDNYDDDDDGMDGGAWPEDGAIGFDGGSPHLGGLGPNEVNSFLVSAHIRRSLNSQPVFCNKIRSNRGRTRAWVTMSTLGP